MKKSLLFLVPFSMAMAAQAQGIKGIVKKAAQTDVVANTGASQILSGGSAKNLSSTDIVNGLKEALSVGSENAARQLAATDGFFKDAAIKVLMPEEAKKVESKLRSLGMGKQVDAAILSMNRAAEDAASSVAPIFIKAIREISIEDGVGILKGGDFAATGYLKTKTTAALTEAFRPVIETSLQKVDATRHWNAVFTTYNRFSSEKVNTDLVAYVTEKALAGIFHQVGLEEQKIRKDPLARTSDLLKKVFAN